MSESLTNECSYDVYCDSKSKQDNNNVTKDSEDVRFSRVEFNGCVIAKDGVNPKEKEFKHPEVKSEKRILRSTRQKKERFQCDNLGRIKRKRDNEEENDVQTNKKPKATENNQASNLKKSSMPVISCIDKSDTGKITPTNRRRSKDFPTSTPLSSKLKMSLLENQDFSPISRSEAIQTKKVEELSDDEVGLSGDSKILSTSIKKFACPIYEVKCVVKKLKEDEYVSFKDGFKRYDAYEVEQKNDQKIVLGRKTLDFIKLRSSLSLQRFSRDNLELSTEEETEQNIPIKSKITPKKMLRVEGKSSYADSPIISFGETSEKTEVKLNSTNVTHMSQNETSSFYPHDWTNDYESTCEYFKENRQSDSDKENKSDISNLENQENEPPQKLSIQKNDGLKILKEIVNTSNIFENDEITYKEFREQFKRSIAEVDNTSISDGPDPKKFCSQEKVFESLSVNKINSFSVNSSAIKDSKNESLNDKSSMIISAEFMEESMDFDTDAQSTVGKLEETKNQRISEEMRLENSQNEEKLLKHSQNDGKLLADVQIEENILGNSQDKEECSEISQSGEKCVEDSQDNEKLFEESEALPTEEKCSEDSQNNDKLLEESMNLPDEGICSEDSQSAKKYSEASENGSNISKESRLNEKCSDELQNENIDSEDCQSEGKSLKDAQCDEKCSKTFNYKTNFIKESQLGGKCSGDLQNGNINSEDFQNEEKSLENHQKIEKRSQISQNKERSSRHSQNNKEKDNLSSSQSDSNVCTPENKIDDHDNNDIIDPVHVVTIRERYQRLPKILDVINEDATLGEEENEENEVKDSNDDQIQTSSANQINSKEANAQNEVIFLKPGKSWTRSLSILNSIHSGKDLDKVAQNRGKHWRHSVLDVLNMQTKGNNQFLESSQKLQQKKLKLFRLFFFNSSILIN